MPTGKPRLQITLSEPDYLFFKEFGKLQGIPAATLISQYLHEGMPIFRQLAEVMQEMKKVDVNHMTDTQRNQLIAALDGGVAIGENELLMISDSIQAVRAAQPRGTPEKARQSLIHISKVPKPIPARLPAVSTAKKKGTKNASPRP